jgi:hypothetical protein
VSSSGISTTAARLPLTGAGAGGIDGAVTAVVMAATAYCGSTAAATLRRPSLVVVAALPAARDALNERRLVGTDASALITFAGASRGDGRRHPANAKSKGSNSRP